MASAPFCEGPRVMAAPRGSGQLDEISQAIGRLEASFESCERYIHQRVHDDREVSAKIDGLSHQITKEVARMKADFQVQFDAMDRRVGALERTGQQHSGERNAVAWFLQSPITAWIAAAITIVIAWWRKS